MKMWLVALICAGYVLKGYAQLPPEERLTDWTVAGLMAPVSSYVPLSFPGKADGVTDQSPLLQAILDTLSRPTIILFGEGEYAFKKGIRLPSNVVIKGLGSNKTVFVFDQGSRHEASFLLRGTEPTKIYTINKSVKKGDRYFETTNDPLLKSGNMIRFLQNDSAFINDDWALGSIGQIANILQSNETTIETRSPFRLDLEIPGKPGYRKITPVENSGIECLKIIRKDYTNTGSGSSNIVFKYARNCWVKAIESEQCNFAHIEVNYSTNLLIEKNYFHHGLNYGANGRAYGIMLQYTTGEVLVQNNIFSNLRHAMILQAGANGNVFAYNYAYDGKKEIFPGFYVAGEDMVLHGNYTFANLFESNVAQFASIDNSHGKNGPFNTYFRNMVTLVGFSISNSYSNAQNIIANHRLNGMISINAKDHMISENSWQGSSNFIIKSMVFKEAPSFLNKDNFGEIGPPDFDVNALIPAQERVLSKSYTEDLCNVLRWEGNHWNGLLEPSIHTSNYSVEILPGNPVLLKDTIYIKALKLHPGSEVKAAPNSRIYITGTAGGKI